MQSRFLIDAIVRNTTVLIAHLSTAAGLRAPLAHIANQVFLELAQELERQGVRQKVAADMFGMALRSFQKKTRRLLESRTDADRTLWGAVLEFIASRGPVTRSTIDQRFRRDDVRDLGAVLKDLTGTGLVYVTGRGAASIYGLASARDHAALSASDHRETIHDLVWLLVYQRGPISTSDLASELPSLSAADLADALATLRDARRISSSEAGHQAASFVVPVGAERGWEAAVLDHFQAVTGAIAAKLRSGQLASQEQDVVGGATLTFDIWEGHPREQEIEGLLESVRARANELWKATQDLGEPADAVRKRIWFYVGQNVQSERDGRVDPIPVANDSDWTGVATNGTETP